MTDRPGFGVLLTRLLRNRGTDTTWLSASSGVAESGIRAVTDGAPPSEPQLRGLAPALGFHAADLFVMADVPLPADLTPLDRAASGVISDLVHLMMALPSGQRRPIHQLAGELPWEPGPRDAPVQLHRPYDRQEAWPGVMLVTMLRGNRNLSLHDAAYAVAALTRGRMYLSPSTYASMAHGRTPVRPDWVAGFATALDIPAGDLAAVTGIEPPAGSLRDDPLASELAALVWNLRSLSAAQIRHVLREARAMLVAVPADAPDREWNRVYHRADGVWLGAPRTDEG